MKWPVALRSLAGALEERLRRAVARRLDRKVAAYELRVPNRMVRLYQHIRKGDVVLVDGERRISQLVKYATQSQWSHSALYVGDALLRRGGRLGEEARAAFGPLADRLLVEALTEEGVVAAPLAKYRWHNIRVCRPCRIGPAALDRVVESVVGDLGKSYDDRNVLDLALMLLSPVKFGPLKARSIEACLGNCTELQVICSGMIARAFQGVGYPILSPIGVGGSPDEEIPDADDGHGLLPMRHYSQIVPRDFDLSPNFQVIKCEIFEPDSVTATRFSPSAEAIGSWRRRRGVLTRAAWPVASGIRRARRGLSWRDAVAWLGRGGGEGAGVRGGGAGPSGCAPPERPPAHPQPAGGGGPGPGDLSARLPEFPPLQPGH
ncbi:MAG: hypothetical protein HYS36_08845 [Candidatus Rokubacteria bacterium]|nr:hypothetical protein [Candidatus Rokubacteria bacterium]MBI2527093.1 hypothetical protein [Candidatus Rokubacteria bacterium]